MDAAAGLALLRRSRDVRPNDGFLEQLLALDTDQKLVRQLGREPSIVLASVEDLADLPRPWNYEFYTKEVTEEEVGTPLVHLGEPSPLRLSGFSSLASTPICSKSVSRKNSRKGRNASRFPSREPSFKQRNSLSQSVERLLSDDHRACGQEEVLLESEDDLATGDELEELDEEVEQPAEESLEQVCEIIGTPEERWRNLRVDLEDDERPATAALSELSNFSTTTKPHLIQPAAETDFLSLFKVSSAASWRELSTRVTVDLQQEDLEQEDLDTKDSRDFVPTSVKQLLAVCWQVNLLASSPSTVDEVRPWDEPKDKRLFTSLFAAPWGCDCDEVSCSWGARTGTESQVLPGLFIGDAASASNIRFLQVISHLGLGLNYTLRKLV